MHSCGVYVNDEREWILFEDHAGNPKVIDVGNVIGSHLLRSMKKALNPAYQEHIMQSYCEISHVTHFVFRYSVPIRNYRTGSTDGGGQLSQCYSPSMSFEDTKDMKNRVWNAYQKLSLRLRLGSASPHSLKFFIITRR